MAISSAKLVHGISGKGDTCAQQANEIQPVVGVVCRGLAKTVRGGLMGDDDALLFVAELVAYAPNGQDHLRILRVLLDLGTKTIDV